MSGFAEALSRRAKGTMLETAGLRLLDVGEDGARVAMEFAPHLQQLTGLFHTGALLTLADTTATVACMYTVDPTGEASGASFPLAIQLSANLIRNTGAGTVTATARLVHTGRTTLVVETAVHDEQGRLLALVTTTHLVLAAGSGVR